MSSYPSIRHDDWPKSKPILLLLANLVQIKRVVVLFMFSGPTQTPFRVSFRIVQGFRLKVLSLVTKINIYTLTIDDSQTTPWIRNHTEPQNALRFVFD